jgi:hypothetical protein
MKKKQITIDRKLSLDREIVGKLDAEQMEAIAGGSVNTATCVHKEDDDNEFAKSCDACSCNGPKA